MVHLCLNYICTKFLTKFLEIHTFMKYLQNRNLRQAQFTDVSVSSLWNTFGIYEQIYIETMKICVQNTYDRLLLYHWSIFGSTFNVQIVQKLSTSSTTDIFITRSHMILWPDDLSIFITLLNLIFPTLYRSLHSDVIQNTSHSSKHLQTTHRLLYLQLGMYDV